MRYLHALALVAASNVAATAAPLPCAPTNPPVRWVVARGAATACFTTDDHAAEVCYRIAPGAAPKRVAVPTAPPAPPPAVELRDDAGAPAICRGRRCTPLGPRLAAEVASVRAQYSGDIPITGDGEVVVIEEGGSRGAWRVDRDRKLDLVPPPTRHKDATFALMSIAIAAGVMVATWEDCAGPCGLSTIVDSRGKNVGGWFGTGHPVTLDAQRIAILPTDDGARFLVLDAATGRRLAAAKLGGFDMQLPAVIDERTLLALWVGEAPDKGGLWEFHFVTVPPGKPARVGPPIRVPWCRP